MRPVQFLQDDDGTLSATRLAFLVWVIGVFVVWSIISLKENKLEPIDNSIALITGALMAGKVAQKPWEKGPNPPPATPQPPNTPTR